MACSLAAELFFFAHYLVRFVHLDGPEFRAYLDAKNDRHQQRCDHIHLQTHDHDHDLFKKISLLHKKKQNEMDKA